MDILSSPQNEKDPSPQNEEDLDPKNKENLTKIEPTKSDIREVTFAENNTSVAEKSMPRKSDDSVIKPDSPRHSDDFTDEDFFNKKFIPRSIPEGHLDVLEELEEQELEDITEEQTTDEDVRYIDPKISISSGIAMADILPNLRKDSHVSGDFKGLQVSYEDWSIFGNSVNLQIPEVSKSLEEMVDEESLEISVARVNREQLYEKINNLQLQIQTTTIRHTILEKYIASYYRKKNLHHFLSEKQTVQWGNEKSEYYKKLDTLGKLYSLLENEVNASKAQIENLQEIKKTKFELLKKQLNAMIHREIEVGRGLINRKTGKEISDSLIEQYINRQKTFMKKLTELRLLYIKIKTAVFDKLKEISSIDQVAEGYNLERFIKLKTQNRLYGDKIEEKDEELNKLRKHIINTMEYLAHIREKSAAEYEDNYDFDVELSECNKIIQDLRQQITKEKQERDKYRLITRKMKEKSGLLMEPALLADMEKNLKLRDELQLENNKLTLKYELQSKQIKNIRQRLDKITVPTKDVKKLQVSSNKSIKRIPAKNDFFKIKTKPSVPQIRLPQGVFDKELKPTVKRIPIQFF